jgi:hypothetical protein
VSFGARWVTGDGGRRSSVLSAVPSGSQGRAVHFGGPFGSAGGATYHDQTGVIEAGLTTLHGTAWNRSSLSVRLASGPGGRSDRDVRG